MEIDKAEVVGKLRQKGDHDKAQQAECTLPQQVDTERDAGLIHAFDLNVREVAPEQEDGP